jgi:hypothetical protein
MLRRSGCLVRQSPRDALTIAHIGVTIALVELLIRWVRLPTLSRMLGVRLDLGPAASAEAMPLRDFPSIVQRQLRWAWKVADLWPFSKGPCLRRALVGGHLVRRLHPVLRIGLGCGSDELSAHAWLEIDGKPLEYVDRYATFVAAPASARQ